MNILDRTVRRLERFEALDKVARTVGRAVRPRVVCNLLSGTYLGEPQHPVLTDLPIGGVGDVGLAGRRRPPRAVGQPGG